MIPVDIIGIGIQPEDLPSKLRALIRASEVLVGAERHLALFPDAPARKEVLDRNLKKMAARIERWMKTRKVVVLASGDPLFFGIGSYLTRMLGSENVVVHPNVSSVAAAFARIKTPWHDAAVFSLHGRHDYRLFLETVRKKSPVAVLTDPDNHPGRLARLCLDNQLGDLQMCVFEQLGTKKERHRWIELARAVRMRFREPNLAIFQRLEPDADNAPALQLGLPERWYQHEHGVVTKPEVRAVTLAKLQLTGDLVMWDLGAGSGSIAIEASLLIDSGRIVAVEKNSRRVQQIRRNAERFGVKNLKVVEANMPDGLTSLPRPDRIFIGGGGRQIRSILQAATELLKPEGVVVVNTVLLPSLAAATGQLQRLGFETDVVQVQINRSKTMPWGERLAAENPVWIISGTRPPNRRSGSVSRNKK